MAFDSSFPPAALFDLDGVIIDTEGQYTLFWDMIGRQYLRQVDFGAKIKGETLQHIFAEHFGALQAEQPGIRAALDDFEAKMDMPWVPGFRAFHRSLQAAGWKTAVVTSSSAGKMNSVYRKLPEIPRMFDQILTAEMFPRSKPAPDPYLLGAGTFGLPSGNCLVFEDSINGLKAGRAAAMRVVGLATTNPAETVSRYADITLADFTAFDAEKALAVLRGN